jgi:hypothetical protein
MLILLLATTTMLAVKVGTSIDQACLLCHSACLVSPSALFVPTSISIVYVDFLMP